MVLKPGVATHLCVAKVLGCVAKRFLNLWANQKKYIAAVTTKVFAERNFIINIIGFILSISLCSKMITLSGFSKMLPVISCVEKKCELKGVAT